MRLGSFSFDDLVQPFQIENFGVRGRLVRLGPALEAILGPHRYPPAVAGLLGETMALAAVLASGLKYEGVFTLQTQSDGPVGMIVADVDSEGGMRGYARLDEDRVAGALAGGVPESPVPKLLGCGHLAFTVDQGPDTERYQGITPLEGATLTECAHNYFRQSEQLETAIVLAGSEAEPDAAARAAALVIQRLPGGADAEDEWRQAVILMISVTAGEMLDASLTPTDILYRLYHREGVRVYRQRPLRHACRCSRERVAATLGAFSRRDVEDMAVDGNVTVTCEFCKSDYVFAAADIAGLYAG